MTKEAKEHESWLVLRAQAGDREAFDALLQLVQSDLFRYVSNLVREDGLAEDVLQEVFLRIYRKLGWLREPSFFRPWAYRIATNEAFRQLKRHRRWSEEVCDEETLAAIPALPENQLEISPLLAMLSPASRAVIVLHYLHELSLEEVADVLDLPIGTVKSRLAYGLRQMRKGAPP